MRDMDRNSTIERWRLPLLGDHLEAVRRDRTDRGRYRREGLEAAPPVCARHIADGGVGRVRRLILAAARDIVVEPTSPGASGAGEAKNLQQRQAQGRWRSQAQAQTPALVQPVRRAQARWPPFQKEAPWPEPRIRFLGGPPIRGIGFHRFAAEPPPAPPAPVVEEKTSTTAWSVRRTWSAVSSPSMDAVQDIPRHAMRLARWQARPKEDRRPERWSPLRPGRPPGFRQRPIHEVDEILKECHWLALSENPPLDDTS